MNALFNINFRREAHERELAHARRRVITLGVWVAYFGIVGVAMGLYGLNCMSLSRRVVLLERQAARLKSNQTEREQWQIPPAEMVRIESYLSNPRRWHERLLRLAELVPNDVRLTSIATSPGNQAGQGQNRLIIMGQIRVPKNQDRMSGVMAFAGVLRDDSTFSAHFRNVRTTSTRILEGGDMTEFVIECQ